MRIRHYTSKIVLVSLSVALLCGCSSNGNNNQGSSAMGSGGGNSNSGINSISNSDNGGSGGSVSSNNSSNIYSNVAEYAQLVNKVTALEAENLALKQQLESFNHEAKAADTQVQDIAAFTDLANVPTAKMIEELSQLKVFDGEGSTFRPNETITRAEYCHWLFNAYNALMPDEKHIRFNSAAPQIFKDCAPGHKLYPYVQALASAGFSIGYDDGTFRPDQPLTREEMLGIKLGVDVGKTLDPWRSQMEATWKFSDGKDVAERFTGYVHQDFYVSGPHGGNIQRAFGKIGAFHPKQSVLRNEAAATLWQIGQFGFTQHTTATTALSGKSGQS